MRKLLLCLLLIAACSNEDASDNVIQGPSTTSASTTSTTAFEGDTTPTSIASTAGGVALLTDVTVEPGLVTLTFRDGQVPGIDAAYVEPPIVQDGSGATVEVAGSAFLQLRLEPASGVDLSSDDFEETYTGPQRVPGIAPVTEVVRTGDFEANLTWVIGLVAERPYRVEADASSVRVYISR